jgi:hypothetical protein
MAKSKRLRANRNATVFEATQTVLAALTLAEEGKGEQGIMLMLDLPAEAARYALWIVLGTVMQGFDSDEDRQEALRIVARVIAAHEDTTFAQAGFTR